MAEVRLDLTATLVFMGWMGRTGRNDQFSVQEQQATALLSRYRQDKDLDTLREAVRLYRAALASDPGRAAYAHNLGHALQMLSQHDEDPALVRQAVAACRVAVAGRPDGNTNKAIYLASLANSLTSSAKQAPDADRAGMVAEAIALYRGSLARTPKSDSRWAELHTRIGFAARNLSELTGDAAQLAEAVTAFRAALAVTPEGDPNRGRRLGALANGLRAQFRGTGDRGALDAAIGTFRAALAALPPDDSTRLAQLTLLAGCLRDRFARSRDLEDLKAEVRARRLAVKAAPATALRLSTLAVALRELFDLTADAAVLKEVVFISRTAAKATRASDPDRASRLNRYAMNLSTLASRAGDIEQLQEAVALHRDVVAGAAPDDGLLPGYRSDLAAALRALHTRTGDRAALTESVATARDGVADTPPDDPDLGARLTILGNALLDEFRSTGRVELLAEAITAQRAALAAVSPHHARRAGFLHSLGMALEEDYDRTGRTELLEETIQVCRASVAATVETDRHRPNRLNSLGTSLYKFYGRTGEMSTLAEATEMVRAAIDTKPDGDPALSGFLVNLGNCLHSFYRRTGDQAAIIEAHVVFRRAADRLPAGHPMRASALNGVGFALLARYERGAHEDYLTSAVQAFRSTIELTPPGHPAKDGHISNLAVALHREYERIGDEDTLREAIELYRTALARSLPGHPDHALRAANLGIALRSLYEKTEDPEVLDEAIAMNRQAVAGTSAAHSDHANGLVGLGGSLVKLFALTGDGAALAEARTVLGQAAQTAAAPIDTRLRAGRQRSTADTLAGDFPAALTAMEGVVGLLPRLAPPGLRRIDRQFRIGEEARLVGAQAAAAALNCGRPDRAVELLEQARGLLIAEALAIGDDLPGLRGRAPELAVELVELRNEIAMLDDTATGRAGGGLGTSGPVQQQSRWEAAEARRVASARWDALLARIRTVPGLEGFWEPPSMDSLLAAAAGSPVVIVTTYRNQCDALILDAAHEHPVRHLPLPSLTEQEARKRAAGFRAALRSAHPATAGLAAALQARLDMRQTLEWLWDTITGPVLEALGHVSPPGPGRTWPRVCWCPVGELSVLPLHAAGYHDSDDGRSVLDRAVSSYTPTVQALAHLRARSLRADSGQATGGTLIVALPDTPNASPLPGVGAEIASLLTLVPDANILIGPAATHEAVLAALPRYPVVHLACHAVTDRAWPDSSQVILHDYATRPLTITQIMRQQLPYADLAYLSACSTSEQSARLANESVHITSAFLLAGYCQVVGTLWEVADHAASRLATQFYRHLTADGIHPPEPGSAAFALHLAVRALRADHPAQPLLWASHVHVGR
jgi:tetratricopeptide (TPR) repeat protein